MTGADRGQAYTLEGLIAAILVASAVLYGLQAVDVAPYAEERTEGDLDTVRTQAGDALRILGDAGELRRAVTCLNSTGAPQPQLGQPPDGDASDGTGNVTALGHVLNESLGYDREYIVAFDYWNPSSGSVESQVIYPSGADETRRFTREPVTATYPVTVLDSTPVRSRDSDPRASVPSSCQPTGQSVGDLAASDVYLPETSPGSPESETYSIVTVRVIAW